MTDQPQLDPELSDRLKQAISASSGPLHDALVLAGETLLAKGSDFLNDLFMLALSDPDEATMRVQAAMEPATFAAKMDADIAAAETAATDNARQISELRKVVLSLAGVLLSLFLAL